MFQAYKVMWKRGLDFKGRSSRGDFWKAYFMNLLVLVGPYFLVTMTLLTGFGSKTFEMEGAFHFMGVILSTYSLFTLVPLLALSIRRLHDANFSAWLFLVNIIPGIGNIVFFILLVLGSKEPNKYPMCK